MRKLNQKQKKLLDRWCAENRSKVHFGFVPGHLEDSLYETLQKENDYETLWQDVRRYVCDKGTFFVE